MYERKIPKKVDCGITFIMEIIGGKWKPCLIYYIDQGAKRPSELQRHNPTAPRRVINQQLKELEEHGIVKRTVYAELPLKVEYSLTDMGKSLLPVILTMYNWGEEQMKKIDDTANLLPEELLA